MLLKNVHFVRRDMTRMIGAMSMDIRLAPMASDLLFCFIHHMSTLMCKAFDLAHR